MCAHTLLHARARTHVVQRHEPEFGVKVFHVVRQHGAPHHSDSAKRLQGSDHAEQNIHHVERQQEETRVEDRHKDRNVDVHEHPLTGFALFALFALSVEAWHARGAIIPGVAVETT